MCLLVREFFGPLRLPRRFAEAFHHRVLECVPAAEPTDKSGVQRTHTLGTNRACLLMDGHMHDPVQ